jgi:hypothetical protein
LNSFKKMLCLFSIFKIHVNTPTLSINHFVAESCNFIDEIWIFMSTDMFTFHVLRYKIGKVNRYVGWQFLIVRPFNVNFACDFIPKTN